MRLVKIPARQLQLHDALDEGQEIWCIATGINDMVVYLGMPGSSLLGNRDMENNRRFNLDDEVIVMRR